MLRLGELLDGLPARPEPRELVAAFVPPARFAAKRLADYHPHPAHPSQRAALVRLSEIAAAPGARGGWLHRALAGPARGSGVYLDGGFGVGKTHLLAGLWHAAPGPSAFLSFDELVHAIGVMGVGGARAAFRGMRLVAVDEWELDDPGNLKLALAFLRGALADGVLVATTSNTVPDELGRGRFDQKSFRAEIEELAGAFEVLRIEGDDYRHRRFEAEPGNEYWLDAAEAARVAARGDRRVLAASFAELIDAIASVHPIRYHALSERMDVLLLSDVVPPASLYEGLRWVHLVDKLYDAEVLLAATSSVGLGELFPQAWMTGPYGKKFSRCLSRLEEMLREARAAAGAAG